MSPGKAEERRPAGGDARNSDNGLSIARSYPIRVNGGLLRCPGCCADTVLLGAVAAVSVGVVIDLTCSSCHREYALTLGRRTNGTSAAILGWSS